MKEGEGCEGGKGDGNEGERDVKKGEGGAEG